MKKSSPRNIGWLNLPPSVAGSKLSDAEKLLLAKIIGLIGNDGFCWAGNEFLAKSLNWSPQKVNRTVTALTQKNQLKRFLIKTSDFKTERRLFPTSLTARLPKVDESEVIKNDESESSKMMSRSINNKENINIDNTSVSDLPDNSKKTTVTVTPLSVDPIEAWDEIPDYPNFFTMTVEQKPKNKEEFFAMCEEWAVKEPQQGRSKVSLFPCTYEEIWHIAKNKKLMIEEVVEKHQEMIRLINEGRFADKYGRPYGSTVYYTLQNWLEMGIRKGRYEQLDDIQMLSVDGEEPVRRRKHRFLVQLRERAKKEGKI